MSQTNKAILEQANAAVSSGDNEGFLKFCTEDTKWTFVGDQILQGKEAVRQFMLKKYVEPPRFDVKNLIAEGDFVVATGYITLSDESGKMIRFSYCDVWQFRDGKMAELSAYVAETKDSDG